MEGETGTFDIVSQFDTYEEYLDSLITQEDLDYLQDEALARRLIELGHRGSGETMKRDEFMARKRELEASKSRPIQKPTQSLCSVGYDCSNKPFLQALADREELVRSGKLSTIIFIRDYNAKGQEISGYIDYAHRLQTEDCRIYFSGKKRMLPRPSDLSYYNWETHTNTSSPTARFQLRADATHGLVFKCVKDRKLVAVDPTKSNGDSNERVCVKTDEYLQVVLYDHVTRRKGH